MAYLTLDDRADLWIAAGKAALRAGDTERAKRCYLTASQLSDQQVREVYKKHGTHW